MLTIDDDTLSLQLEAALPAASLSLLSDLADTDRRRRHVAIGEIIQQFLGRLRCFDSPAEIMNRGIGSHPSLFPNDFGPMGLPPMSAAMDKLDNPDNQH